MMENISENKPGLIFLPFPVLETERLVLRQLADTDAEALYMLRSDETVNKYIDREPPQDIGSVNAFINKINSAIDAHESLYWVIALKPNLDLVGTICLWNFSEDKKTAETGYELMPSYQGKGIMHEALGEMINFAFRNLGMHAIDAFTHRENSASAKLLEKHGFKYIGERKDEENPDNTIFQLLNPI